MRTGASAPPPGLTSGRGGVTGRRLPLAAAAPPPLAAAGLAKALFGIGFIFKAAGLAKAFFGIGFFGTRGAQRARGFAPPLTAVGFAASSAFLGIFFGFGVFGLSSGRVLAPASGEASSAAGVAAAVAAKGGIVARARRARPRARAKMINYGKDEGGRRIQSWDNPQASVVGALLEPPPWGLGPSGGSWSPLGHLGLSSSWGSLGAPVWLSSACLGALLEPAWGPPSSGLTPLGSRRPDGSLQRAGLRSERSLCA